MERAEGRPAEVGERVHLGRENVLAAGDDHGATPASRVDPRARGNIGAAFSALGRMFERCGEAAHALGLTTRRIIAKFLKRLWNKGVVSP